MQDGSPPRLGFQSKTTARRPGKYAAPVPRNTAEQIMNESDGIQEAIVSCLEKSGVEMTLAQIVAGTKLLSKREKIKKEIKVLLNYRILQTRLELRQDSQNEATKENKYSFVPATEQTERNLDEQD